MKVRKILSYICDFMLVMLLLVVLPGIIGDLETRYTIDGVVTSIEEDVAIITTANGYDWSWTIEEEDSMAEGEAVKVTMYTNHTDSNIYDDEIIKIIKE